jgi:hypothetical protein
MKPKKESKEIVLLDTYPSSKMFDELKADLEREEGEVSEERVWDKVDESIRFAIDDFNEALEEMDMTFSEHSAVKSEYVLMGTVGTWRGNMVGGKYLDTLPDLLHAMGGVDYVKVYAQDNRVYIEGSHHDGTHHMELRMRKITTTDERWERLEEEYFENAHTCTKSTYFMFKSHFGLK